jgi:hypothetical protein
VGEAERAGARAAERSSAAGWTVGGRSRERVLAAIGPDFGVLGPRRGAEGLPGGLAEVAAGVRSADLGAVGGGSGAEVLAAQAVGVAF